jgi:farnesyl-diphosphate farnesyltransferase
MPLLHELLLQTSRTFGLAIPLLPAPLRREVTIAYLLFRIADTCEDATRWPSSERRAALADFAALLESPSGERARELAAAWCERPPADHVGYRRLLAHLPDVLAATLELDGPARRIIIQHTRLTAAGMSDYVGRMTDDHRLALRDLLDLRQYCYTVAGLVGELLTELFLLRQPSLQADAGRLRPLARLFGEGLQLVNVLKDAAEDARAGRTYLPASVPRGDVFALARADLQAAEEYVAVLKQHEVDAGVCAFAALSLQLAWATLLRVERDGPGAKLKRSEVAAILQRLAAVR